ncbi:MAG: M56 family metallopeptidase [Chitinophagaceae bacterium]
MPQFFIILFKINLVLALFAIAYYGILRRLTFYSLNRLFLVFGILFSTVYPFIDLTDLFHRNQNPGIAAFVPAINERVKEWSPLEFIARNEQLISTLFYAGVVIMTIRLVFQFLSLYRLHKKSSRGVVDEMSVRILEEEVSPFSFWQTIYINPSLHQQKDLHSILEHEHVHIKQWHTLDILLAELSVVFYWFNPGVWLMRKAVKENLEFITDEKVLRKGVDKKAYQYSLLEVGNLASTTALASSFNISDLKKRIVMMNAKRSSKLTLGRYAMVLPVLLLLTLAFTVSKREVVKYLEPVLPQVLQSPGTEKVMLNEQAPVKRNVTGSQAKRRNSQDLAITNEGSGTAGIKPARMLTGVAVQAVRIEGGDVTVGNNSRYNSINPGDAINKLLTPASGKEIKEVTVVGHSRRSSDTARTITISPATKTVEGFRVVQGYPTSQRGAANKEQ